MFKEIKVIILTSTVDLELIELNLELLN